MPHGHKDILKKKIEGLTKKISSRAMISLGSVIIVCLIITLVIIGYRSNADTVNTIVNQAQVSFCDASNTCSTATSNSVSTTIIGASSNPPVVVTSPSPVPPPVVTSPSPVIVPTPSPSPVVVPTPSPSPVAVPTPSPSPIAVVPTPVVPTPVVPPPAAPQGIQKLACNISFSNRTDKDHSKVLIKAEKTDGTVLAQATITTSDGHLNLTDATVISSHANADFITIHPIGYLKQRIAKSNWSGETCATAPTAFTPGDFAGKGDTKIRLTDVLALIQFYRSGKSAVEGTTFAYKDKSRVNLATILGFIQQYRKSNQ